MTLQLFLSFGHIHLDRIASSQTAVTIAGANSSGHLPSPAQHPANDADDYCAICAIIHLASTSFLPEPPPLPLPCVARTVEHCKDITFGFVARQRTVFQSRAPPLA